MNDKEQLKDTVEVIDKESSVKKQAQNGKNSKTKSDEASAAPTVTFEEKDSGKPEVKKKRTYTRKTTTQSKKTSAAKKIPKATDDAEAKDEIAESSVADIPPTELKPQFKAKLISETQVKNTEDVIDFTPEEYDFIPDAASLFDDGLADNALPFDEEFFENRILPPDELFADRYTENKADENTVDPDENSEQPAFEDDAPESVAVDDDGQYRFAELEESDDEIEIEADVDPEPEKYDAKKPRRIDNRFDLLELFVFTLLGVMILTSFFFRHSVVEGQSMEDTLLSGEHLIISDLFYTPKRGDVIVCQDYTTSISKPIVKRVIAVAGDTVEITPSGNVYVNGALIEEDYIKIDKPNYSYDDLIITVPEGELFVMGDHRNESTDSRKIGTVSEDSVLGKVLLRFYPFNKFGTVK